VCAQLPVMNQVTNYGALDSQVLLVGEMLS